MKYSIEAMTIEPEFRWNHADELDRNLYFRHGGEEWRYWGMVRRGDKDACLILNAGRITHLSPSTLANAQAVAEGMCAGDILRNLAKIKKETA